MRNGSRGATVATDHADDGLGPLPAGPAPASLSAAQTAVLRALTAVGGPIPVAELAAGLHQHPNTVREHLDALVADGRAERVKSAPAGRGRPAWLYRSLMPESDDEGCDLGITRVGTGHEYTSLALALIDQVASSSPDPRTLARKAGERWGTSLAVEYDAIRRARAGCHAADEPDGPAQAEPPSAGPASAGPASNGQAAAPGAEPVHPNDAVVEILDDLRFAPEPAPESAPIRLTTCPILDAAKRNPDVVCQIHLGIVRGALTYFGADADGAGLDAFAAPGACLLTLPDR